MCSPSHHPLGVLPQDYSGSDCQEQIDERARGVSRVDPGFEVVPEYLEVLSVWKLLARPPKETRCQCARTGRYVDGYKGMLTKSRTPVPVDEASPAAMNMKNGRPYHHLISINC